MTAATVKIYIPQEYAEDVTWAKSEFTNKPFNKILLDLLHEAREKAEAEKCVAAAEMTGDDTEQAKGYYRRLFGFLKTDYKDDRDILTTLGETRTLNMTETMFKQVLLERPEHYNLCKELFRQEHPVLYKLWI